MFGFLVGSAQNLSFFPEILLFFEEIFGFFVEMLQNLPFFLHFSHILGFFLKKSAEKRWKSGEKRVN